MSTDKIPEDNASGPLLGLGLSEGLGAGPRQRESVSCKPAGLAALARVDYAMLGRLLQLPAGAELHDARTLPDEPGVLFMQIRGAGWPTHVGWKIGHARAICTEYRDDSGRVFKTVIDWQMPAPNVAGNRRACGTSG